MKVFITKNWKTIGIAIYELESIEKDTVILRNKKNNIIFYKKAFCHFTKLEAIQQIEKFKLDEIIKLEKRINKLKNKTIKIESR